MGNLKAVFLTCLITFVLGILLAFYLYGTRYEIVGCGERNAYKVNRITGQVFLLTGHREREVKRYEPGPPPKPGDASYELRKLMDEIDEKNKANP